MASHKDKETEMKMLSDFHTPSHDGKTGIHTRANIMIKLSIKMPGWEMQHRYNLSKNEAP